MNMESAFAGIVVGKAVSSSSSSSSSAAARAEAREVKRTPSAPVQTGLKKKVKVLSKKQKSKKNSRRVKAIELNDKIDTRFAKKLAKKNKRAKILERED